MPLFPEVEESLSQVFRVGISLAGSALPLPRGEGGAHAPGAGEIPVLAGNREDLAGPLIRPFGAPCM